jgi:hypothetical protein
LGGINAAQTIKADLAADGELLVGSKDTIQKTKKMPYPPS